jgi:hypothetical protein
MPAVPVQQQIVVNVAIDGKPFDQKIVTQIKGAFGEFADALPRQRNG